MLDTEFIPVEETEEMTLPSYNATVSHSLHSLCLLAHRLKNARFYGNQVKRWVYFLMRKTPSVPESGPTN